MIRKIIAVLVGGILFIALVGVIVGIFARLGITPEGQFIQSAFKERTGEETAEFIASDEGFNLMSQGVNFIGFVILPAISIIAGFLTGWLSKTKGWVCSIIAIGPFAIFIMGYGSLTSVFSIMICILLAAIGGYGANKLITARSKRV